MGQDDLPDVPDDWGGGFVPCPTCAEPIRAAAKKCRFCGHLVQQAFEPSGVNLDTTIQALETDSSTAHPPSKAVGEVGLPAPAAVDNAPFFSSANAHRLIVLGSLLVIAFGLVHDVVFSGRLGGFSRHRVVEYQRVPSKLRRETNV